MIKQEHPNSGRKIKTETIQVIDTNIPNQIRGKWFPDGKVKKGTRWFYIILLTVSLLAVASMITFAVAVILGGNDIRQQQQYPYDYPYDECPTSGSDMTDHDILIVTEECYRSFLQDTK